MLDMVKSIWYTMYTEMRKWKWRYKDRPEWNCLDLPDEGKARRETYRGRKTLVLYNAMYGSTKQHTKARGWFNSNATRIYIMLEESRMALQAKKLWKVSEYCIPAW